MVELILIRHGEVETCWKSICYGAMDVALSESGRQASRKLAVRFAQQKTPRSIFHSDLSRTRFLAGQMIEASRVKIPVVADSRLRERDYGQWQGITWDAAYASDPEHFQDLIDRPDTYRPPDGETTSEMQNRIVAWYQETVAHFEKDSDATIVAISHSGPIAALAGWLTGTPANQWAPWMLKPLEWLTVQMTNAEPLLTRSVASDSLK